MNFPFNIFWPQVTETAESETTDKGPTTVLRSWAKVVAVGIKERRLIQKILRFESIYVMIKVFLLVFLCCIFYSLSIYGKFNSLNFFRWHNLVPLDLLVLPVFPLWLGGILVLNYSIEMFLSQVFLNKWNLTVPKSHQLIPSVQKQSDIALDSEM